MPIYNTASNAANTAVRAFLTKIGEEYLGQRFDIMSGSGKEHWARISEEVFEGKCAFCGTASNSLPMVHLVMLNKQECGLHHPGNVVPCCAFCSRRQYDSDSCRRFTWKEQLAYIFRYRGLSADDIEQQREKIIHHIVREDYPIVRCEQLSALKVVTENLYERVAGELEQSVALFKTIDRSLGQ